MKDFIDRYTGELVVVIIAVYLLSGLGWIAYQDAVFKQDCIKATANKPAIEVMAICRLR
jgi:hypothetical protein